MSQVIHYQLAHYNFVDFACVLKRTLKYVALARQPANLPSLQYCLEVDRKKRNRNHVYSIKSTVIIK